MKTSYIIDVDEENGEYTVGVGGVVICKNLGLTTAMIYLKAFLIGSEGCIDKPKT